MLFLSFAVGAVLAILASCTFSLAPLQDSPGGDASPEAACADDILSSPVSCGACGRDCGGGACDGGHCQPYVMSDAETQSYGLAQDETYLYYTLSIPSSDSGSGEIRRMRKDTLDGGSITLATGEDTPKFLVIDDRKPVANLFWTSSRGVSTMPADGSQRPTVLCAEPHAAYALAVDPASDDVFYTVTENDAATKYQGSVHRCSSGADGGDMLVAAATFPKAIVVDPSPPSTLYWTSYCDLADFLDSGDGTCGEMGRGSVYSIPTAPPYGTPTNLSNPGIGPGAEGFVVEGNYVYVTAKTENALYSGPANHAISAPVTKIYQGPPNGLNQVVSDPTAPQTLYLSALTTLVVRFTIGDDGGTTLWADDRSDLISMVVDGEFVYWTTQGGNSLVRLRK